MILRRVLKRNGPPLLKSSARWNRTLATEVNNQSSQDVNKDLDVSTIQPQTISEKTEPSDMGVRLVSQDDGRARMAQQLLNDGRKEAYEQYRHRNVQTRPLGSEIAPHYIPQKILNHPPWPKDITLELLLASQCHLGHKTTHWNPANSRYIFGIRQGIHVISLDVTAAHLRRACRVVTGVAERGGLILFAGTRPGHQRLVTQAASLAGGYHVFERWVSGAITNRNQILGSCRLKVVDHLDRNIPGQEDLIRKEPALKPDLVICLNPLENWVLLHECALEGIPTIGVIDTDANPTWVTYPIPANDDSLRCIQLISGVLGRAGELGKMRRKEAAGRGAQLDFAVDLDKKREDVLTPAGGKKEESKEGMVEDDVGDFVVVDENGDVDIKASTAALERKNPEMVGAFHDIMAHGSKRRAGDR